MKKIVSSLIFIFPTIANCQWTTIVPYTNNIVIISPLTSEPITLIKNSDTVWFSDWKRNLKLFGLPNSNYSGEDFSEIDLIDSVELAEAYELACTGCALKWPVSPQATIEFPEMNFLYRGYDNVFKVAANWIDGVKEYRIEATDATVKTITRDNQIAHTINPKGKTSEVKVIYKDIEGFEHSYGPWVYSVRMMPKPIISNVHISKSAGGIIRVILPPDFIIGGVVFQVKKIEVNGNTLIEGDIIAPESIKKVKVGKRIPLIVTAINLNTDEEIVINSSIEVVK